MKIAVVGAGHIGGTIGAKWEAAGHDVVYGLRDPGKKPGAKTIGEALKGADAVLLAIPGGAVTRFVHDHANDLDGKIVLDATNNFGGDSFHQWTELASRAPNAHLYRAFNTYGWDVFADATLGGEQPDLFYAGPDGSSRDGAESLISDVGLRPIWVGGADAVGVVDGVLRLWLTLSRTHGRRIALKLITD